MIKKSRRGFTLVEMMVAMTIIAILSVLAVSAIINLNSSNVVDRGAEELVTYIREAQNKAISASSSPVSGEGVPVGWGVYVTAGTIQPFYLDYNNQYQPFGNSHDYSLLDAISVTGTTYHFFTTPFGKYYTSNTIPTVWIDNEQRPYDSIPTGISEPTEPTLVEFRFRSKTRNVTIETDGDVNAK